MHSYVEIRANYQWLALPLRGIGPQASPSLLFRVCYFICVYYQKLTFRNEGLVTLTSERSKALVDNFSESDRLMRQNKLCIELQYTHCTRVNSCVHVWKYSSVLVPREITVLIVYKLYVCVYVLASPASV